MLLEFMGVSLTVLWGRWLTADPTVAQIRHSNLDSRGQFFDTSGQGTAGASVRNPAVHVCHISFSPDGYSLRAPPSINGTARVVVAQSRANRCNLGTPGLMGRV